jgi:hypothetical protein
MLLFSIVAQNDITETLPGFYNPLSNMIELLKKTVTLNCLLHLGFEKQILKLSMSFSQQNLAQ